MDDQFMLGYISDGIVYPVAMSTEQNRLLQDVIPSIISNEGKVTVVKDKPLGEAFIVISPKNCSRL